MLQREQRLHGADHSRTLLTLHRLASISGHHGRYAEAIAADEKVLRALQTDSEWFKGEVYENLALGYWRLADYPKGMEYRSKEIEFLRQHFGGATLRNSKMVADRGYLHGILGQWAQCLDDNLAAWTNGFGHSDYHGFRTAVAALLAGDTNAYRG